MLCEHGVEYEDMCQACYTAYDELCQELWVSSNSKENSMNTGSVKSITAPALTLADLAFAPKPKVEAPKVVEDKTVYGEIQYNVENDGNIHIVIPQAIMLSNVQQNKGMKYAAYVTVKAESVDFNVTHELPDGSKKETVLTTKPVDFELRFAFDKPEEPTATQETPVGESK